MRSRVLTFTLAVWGSLMVDAAFSATACTDEGMWLFNRLPLETLKSAHGFTPPPGWADHLRSSAVRFNNGGSGSFVSADGLIMTNHHVGADTLAKLSTDSKDYYRDGFFARTYAEEAKAPDLELNVLLAIEDVTDRVNRDVSSEQDDAAAAVKRRQAMAEIEKEATEKNGLRNDVVTLYQGGQYHLYTYKKYTDVRLVFAPNSTSRSSAATPITSSIHATISTSVFFGLMRMASRPRSSTTSCGAKAVQRKGSSCSWPDTPAGRIGSTRSPVSSSFATSSFRHGSSI